MAKPPAPPNSNGRTDQSSTAEPAGLDHSLLQPRLAVALGVPKRWHPFLIVARLLSIVPALWWGMRCALRFLFTEFILSDGPKTAPSGEDSRLFRAESSLRLTETLLAMVWVRLLAPPPFLLRRRRLVKLYVTTNSTRPDEGRSMKFCRRNLLCIKLTTSSLHSAGPRRTSPTSSRTA